MIFHRKNTFEDMKAVVDKCGKKDGTDAANVEMLKDMEVELHYLAEWPGIEAPEENGRTFAANARLKATYYAKATGMDLHCR